MWSISRVILKLNPWYVIQFFNLKPIAPIFSSFENFLTLNVDNGDQPVNINIRPGQYNAAQLASEVERSINEAYGDDKKIQVVQNVDDSLNINLFGSAGFAVAGRR